MLISQIDAGIKALTLTDPPSTDEIKAAAPKPLIGALPPQSVQPYLDAAGQAAVRRVHIDLLTKLTTSGFKLGKAYTTRPSCDRTTVGRR
jgi:hypothetical protein